MKRTLTLAALSVVLLAGCSSGSGTTKATGTVTSSGPATAQTAQVGMTDRLVFSPSTVNAKVGMLTLSAKNEGSTPHNLTFDDKSFGKTGTIAGKETKSVTLKLDKAGTYTFTCTFHEGMNGRVVVS